MRELWIFFSYPQLSILVSRPPLTELAKFGRKIKRPPFSGDDEILPSAAA